jgi:hypothetical protein
MVGACGISSSGQRDQFLLHHGCSSEPLGPHPPRFTTKLNYYYTVSSTLNLTLNYDKLIIYYTSILYMYTILYTRHHLYSYLYSYIYFLTYYQFVYHLLRVYILIFIVILFYLMLRKHLKKSKNKTIFQLKRRVKLFVNEKDFFLVNITKYIYIYNYIFFFFCKDNCQHKYYSYKELI